nr:penicillin-binding protein 2 [Chloroflexia bacterium]
MRVIIPTIAGLTAVGLISYGLAFSSGITDTRWLAILGIAWLLLLVASRIRLPFGLAAFNRSLIRTAMVLATVFLIISAQLVRIQVVRSDETYYRSAESRDGEVMGNPRVVNSDLSIDRGDIVDRNGVLIAGTERDGNVFVRSYPDPTTAYVAGYYSPLLYGSSGLEEAFNEELVGQAGNDPVGRVTNDLLNRPQKGSTLRLTLDSGLQASATQLLGESNGGVVVMDATSGEVLVMASNPAYDPNRLFTSQPSQRDAATAYWNSLLEQPDAPLVLRPTMGLFAPGSVFKTVTAAIGIEAGYVEPDEIYEDTGELTIDGRLLIENNRPDPSRTEWTATEGMAWSLNVVFAQIGLEIGATDYWENGERFGFGTSIPFDVPVAQGQLASSEEFLRDNNALADTGFGQGEILVSPLQMALVTSMYVNDGAMMRPFLVDGIVDAEGEETRETAPEVWQQSVSPDTAADVEQMMIAAVQNGSVDEAAIEGFRVGGKTGTAETGDGDAHSWFIGFIGEEGGE